MIEIFVDGDACPVKDEIYAVATRLGLAVVVVANQRIHVPRDLGVELIVVAEGPDAADDWIAEEIREGDVVITADIPLAARCLAVGAFALGTNGREFTPDSIGGALATREIKAGIRESGFVTGGPPPPHRSRPLAFLERARPGREPWVASVSPLANGRRRGLLRQR